MEPVPPSTFADRLRQVMEERSITQVGLSRMVGVAQSAVSRWIAGAIPTEKRLRRLATYLDLDEGWLLTGEGKKELPLEERIERRKSMTARAMDAQDLVTIVEGETRAIIIQEHPSLKSKKLQFDKATLEEWMDIVHHIMQRHHDIKMRHATEAAYSLERLPHVRQR